MKLRGGDWSKGDVIALCALLAAILAIPGMPKILPWDSGTEKTNGPVGTPPPASVASTPTSGLKLPDSNYPTGSVVSNESPSVANRSRIQPDPPGPGAPIEERSPKKEEQTELISEQ